MNFNALDNIAGSEGLKSYHGTGAVTGKGLSGITLKVGEYIPAGLGAKITAFTITSGSVLAY
jgi:hypothetical protein